MAKNTRGTKNTSGTSKRRNSKKSSSMTEKYPTPTLPKMKPYKQAERDWEFANEPLLEDIAAEQNRAKDERNEMDTAYGNIHKGLTHDLNKTPWGNYDQIAQTLTSQTAPIVGQAGQFGGPATEQGAWTGAFNAAGNGAQAMLAGIQARDVAYTNSVSNQADVDLANRRSNLIEAYRDTISQLQEERRNILEDRGREVAGYADQYRQQRFENELSLGAYGQSEKAARAERRATKDLIAYLQGQGKSGGGGGGKPWWKDEAKAANADTPGSSGGGGKGKPWWKDEAEDVDSGGGGGKGGINNQIDRQSTAIRWRAENIYDEVPIRFEWNGGVWRPVFKNTRGMEVVGDPVTDTQLLRLLKARKENNRKSRRRGDPVTKKEKRDSRRRGKHGRT